MGIVPFLLILIILFIVEMAYFKIANHFNIIDQPNYRSSHSRVTLRGGGVIFAIGTLLFYCSYGFLYSYFIGGLLAIAIISFLDDILTLSNKIRLGVHLLAVLLLLYQLDLLALPWYWIIFSIIIIIGTINAYNFMDGINGITGGYSIVMIGSLYYINGQVNFTSNEFLIIVGLSLLVFNFFNFRQKARCFAGDVGSVSIAFILVFLMSQLIVKTHHFAYILLLLVYGLDTVSTVLFRKIRKENIFEAHRSHFYQYLANQLKWPHLLVASLYMIIQLMINGCIIFLIKESSLMALSFVLLATLFFIWIRFKVEGKLHLIG